MARRILAVDNELHMLSLLEQLISKKTAYQITTTHNALEVPEMLEEESFDVIITDLKMPGLSGLDILQQVHDHGRGEEVIMITAFPSIETASEALGLGASDYIIKPFKKNRLLQSLERAMFRQQARRDAAFLVKLLLQEPFDAALKQFKLEYFTHMIARTGDDVRTMAQRSGLSVSEVESIVKERNAAESDK